MKIKEIRDLSYEELVHQEEELRNALYNLRVQSRLGKLEKSHQLKVLRRDIAKVLTVLKETEPVNKEDKKGR